MQTGASGDIGGKSIDDIIDSVDDIYKATLRTDLEASVDLAIAIGKKSELLESWKKLSDFQEIRRDISILESYTEVKRIGEYLNEVKPTRISELTPTHSTRKGKEDTLIEMIAHFGDVGYDLSFPIPVIKLPDGVTLLIDGNHRLKSLKELNPNSALGKKVLDL